MIKVLHKFIKSDKIKKRVKKMKRIIQLVLFVFFLCFCASIAISSKADKEYIEYLKLTKDAKRITTSEAYEIFETGKAWLISVDSPAVYAERRILGAINIPATKIDEIFEKGGEIKIPKDDMILLYCR